jgi:hypothetical protein
MYNRESFEASARERFDIVTSKSLPDSDRAMYLLRRR